MRLMIKEDAPGILSLLQKNLSKFHLSPLLSLQEVEHWFLPRENGNDTYVVEVGPHCISTFKFYCTEKENPPTFNLRTFTCAVLSRLKVDWSSLHSEMAACWQMWWASIASPSECSIIQSTLVSEQLIFSTSPLLPQSWQDSWRTRWSSPNL